MGVGDSETCCVNGLVDNVGVGDTETFVDGFLNGVGDGDTWLHAVFQSSIVSNIKVVFWKSIQVSQFADHTGIEMA